METERVVAEKTETQLAGDSRRASSRPVDPFIDREGNRAYIDKAEADLRSGVVH